MARFGINPKNNYGVSVGKLRELVKGVPKDHELAIELWNSGIHEARILAPILEVPSEVTLAQMEKWVSLDRPSTLNNKLGKV